MNIKHKEYNKKFILLNGDTLRIIGKDSLDEARQYAINYLDNSKEIIVREIKGRVIDYTKTYENAG